MYVAYFSTSSEHVITNITENEVIISNPTTSLHSGSETQLRNMSQLAIVGNGSEGEPAVIMCQPLAGLAFFWSTNITMNNLSLLDCGLIQINKNECHPIQVAILFTGCTSVALSNLHVNESNGTGVAVYNAMGKVLLKILILTT